MNKYKITLFLLILLFIGNVGLKAQNSKWKTYRAYQYATMAEASSNYVFAVYDGALSTGNTLEGNGSLLIYSPEDEEVKTFSLEDGLHDSNIGFMKYHPGLRCLIITYQNTNIDLFYGQDDITNIADLKNKEDIQNKQISNIDFIGDYAYISGTFGGLMVDLKKREVKGDFTRWGVEARSFCLWDGVLYTSTSNGLLKADPSSNLQDITNWQTQVLDFDKQREINQMLLFNDQLVFSTNNREVWVADQNFTIRKLDNSANKLRILNNQLVVIQDEQVTFYNDLTQKTIIPLSVKDITSSKEGVYWLANNEKGLTEIEKSKNTNDYKVKTPELKINSPIRNYIFHMNFLQEQLLIAGGGRWGDREYKAGTFMVYENNEWYNLDHKKIAEATSMPCTDLVSAVVDPRNLNHYYVASWGDGVYELRREEKEFKLVKLLTENNSGLQTSPSGTHIRIDGLVYDKNNNLFMNNLRATNGIVVLKNDNTWKSFYASDISLQWLNQLIITRNNLKWGNIFRLSDSGIYVYDDKNTIENTNDDEYYFSKTFTDQTSRSFSASEYLCLAEDLNGIVWVGTNNGPISFSSADQLRRNVCNRMIGTDQYGAGYYVMDGLRVTAIAVDGGNRKWMGTDGNGLFMVDQSGQELVVKNYNSTNSLILSDNITSLAINQQTGEIFIGTDKGLCSYMSDAIEGKSDYSNVYAFPNPVYPLRKNEVTITGLMEKSTLKITDMAGNLIKEATSLGGQYTWDCTDVNKDIVKAGIYLVFATTSDGSEGAVTKIMVIQ